MGQACYLKTFIGPISRQFKGKLSLISIIRMTVGSEKRNISTKNNQDTGAIKRNKSVQSSLLAHFTPKDKSLTWSSSTNSTASDVALVEASNFIEDSKVVLDQSQSPSLKQPKLDLEQTRDKLVSRLTDDDRALLRTELEFLNFSWLRHLFPELTKPYFRQLKKFLQQETNCGYQIFPPESQIYYWSQLCLLESTRVVIIGQDPYHNDRQAMGLCFSVPKDVSTPPSLLNIYKELASDIPGFVAPQHGDLSGWARQGILLLNTSLTVRAHEPASHAGKGWEQLTDAVIQLVNRKRNNVVFILWGAHAQRKASTVDKKRHLILSGVHPSPLSAARGFFGCKHFSRTNEYLIKNNLAPIDWNAL